jgi:fermentation-respiration switch protein FrsA (DUF1100 family)
MRSRARVAVGVILFILAGVVGGVIAAGFLMSAPARATIGAAPADLHAESIAFASDSGATLAGWFILGQPGAGVVVLMHGVRSNRLSMVRRARLLKGAGFSVLLFDFQAHGESTGARITFGHLEGLDARSAVAYVRERLPGERVGAIGTSLGGAAALLAPQPFALDALVLEAAYPDIDKAIANRVRVVLGPTLGAAVAPPAVWLFGLVLPPFLGVSRTDLRPIDHISDMLVPLMVASGTRDTRTTIVEAQAMFERGRVPKSFWAVEDARHVDLEAYAPDDYRSRVLSFLIKQLQQPR